MSYITMPDGVKLFVEQAGSGPPLLMIPGLGAGNWLWWHSKDALAQRFSLIMPELRGSGRSDKPDQTYSVELFASDLFSVLQHLDVRQTHVLGVSMGGLVAQYFAATWPERVRKLILTSTTIGGPEQIGPDGDVLSRLVKPRGRTRKERLENAYDLNFTLEFMQQHRDELDRITEWRLSFPQPEYAYYRQLLAGHAFDGMRHAHEITAETLIMASVDDQVIPMGDVEKLRENLPRARLATFHGKHLFFFEQPEAFNKAVIRFLQESHSEKQT